MLLLCIKKRLAEEKQGGLPEFCMIRLTRLVWVIYVAHVSEKEMSMQNTYV